MIEPHEEQLSLAEVRELAEKERIYPGMILDNINMRILVLDFMFSCMTLMKITAY